MNRNDFQSLAQIRLKEAESLLKNKLYNGSYYLCGYAIECAIKACISKNTKEFDFPDRNIALNSYSHDLLLLIKTAGLENKLDSEIKLNKDFGSNWLTVKDWKVTSRYELSNELKAKDMYNAVADNKNGVLKWLIQYW